MDTDDTGLAVPDDGSARRRTATTATRTDDERAPADVEDDELDDEPDDRRRIVVIAGVAFLVIALLGFVLTRDAEDDTTDGEPPAASVDAGSDAQADGETAAISGTSDDFDRPDTDGGVDPLPSGAAWEFESGDWEIRANEVAVVAPEENRNFMVVDIGYPDQQSQVRLSTAVSGAGLTFRYQDPFHYWAVEPVPEFATLNIIKVTGGEAQGPPESLGVFDKIADVPIADDVTIGVVLSGTQIEFVVNGKVVKILDDPDLAGTGRAGLTAFGPDAGTARFDDFTAGGPTGQGAIGSNERDIEVPDEPGEEPAEEAPDTTEGG